ncbi:hypothetical protein NHX12_027243 [Muraenolepis orangiensis]|uniref:Bromo domain-containing protein n=1 Tax=Muraenolepis orangiensis TaxID=630683 RepID=A0A9Q0EGK2_9TELE|nr:hypothetical protein NHX12_027243 [Muraenolepis orangiensis]
MSSLPAPQWHNSGSQTECVVPLFSTQDALCNGDHAPGAMVEGESVVVVVVVGGDQVGDHVELGGGGGDDDNDCGMSEISGGDLSLPEVCVSTDNASAGFEDDLSYEVQQAYRIFSGFLLDKYKGVTGSFFLPVDHVETQHGVGGVGSPGGAQRRQSVCLRSMEEKFAGRRYDTITAFVADFRLMLENCYRDHGVDHWLSKQAQKLEVMLEQKLTLLSRTLRAKTTLAVTSQGRFGGEEEQRNSGGTSTRRRSAPRSLTTITVGGHESVMVQALRQEELQRAKDGKRQRELDKKEAEETSAKEVEEWERSLLSQASPHSVDTLWELPAIGHFLCLAQTALHLPEIVFFELERSLLMPRCSLFLAKVMSSLLCPPQQRAAVHRQPPLPYRRWERELRQRVLAWYRVTGAATTDQAGRAERLGLCHRFFCVLGELSPLEAAPFHMLPFYQRVWLLKGLCDNVYETQKEVQDTVLAQPIHECRESILGYDGVDNAYIHFPHFCGADLRIYFQGPCTPPTFPFPALWARTIDAKPEAGFDGEDGKAWKGTECHGVSMESEEEEEEKCAHFKRENGGMAEKNIMVTLSSLKEVESDSGSVDEVRTSAKSTVKENAESSRLKHSGSKRNPARRSKRVPRGAASSASDSGRAIEAETHEPRLSVGEHCYTGRSPVWSSSRASPPQPVEVKTEGEPSPEWKDKRRKVQAGKKLENSLNAIKGEPPVEPPFKLVCSSIGDLRELISKTEDQLDTLQSTKKRSGGWYSKKEAVKDLHVTLVRLLKELLPWEPKLVKAFQRNRLRMKKECDDFRKHPDYANFVREEGTEEEDVEHAVPKGLWTRGNTMQLVTNSAGRDTVTYSTPSHPRPSSKNTDEDLNLRRGPPLKTDSSLTSPVNTASESTCEPGAPAQSGDSSPAPLAPALASLRARVPILHPTIGLPRGYTPIPTLFAKSVGNKVTLMKRPVDYPWSGSPKGCVGSEPPSPGTPAKTPAPHKPPSHHPHRTTCPEASERRQANKQPVVSTSTVSLAKPPNTTSTETAAPKSPVKVVYRVTEGPAHVLRRDGAGHAKITVQPLVDQKSGEKMTKQVVILPSKLLLQNNEDACGFTRHPQPSRTVSQYPVSTTAGPSCVSTNVPGFSIPKGRVQPTAPVNEAGRLKIPSLSGSPCLQQNTVTTTSRKHCPCSRGFLTCSVPFCFKVSFNRSNATAHHSLQQPFPCRPSCCTLPKVTSPTPGSRFMFIGEPAAVASCGYMSAVPQQVPATGIGRPPVATSLSGEVLKGSLALGQHVGNVKSESSSNFKHFTLPSGVQLNQMKDFGQTVNSVLQSPSKSTPAITSPGLVLLKASSLVPSSPISPSVSLTTSSSPQKPPSIAVPHREASRSTSTVVTSTTGCTVAKDPPTNVCVPSFNNKSSPGTQNVQHQSIGNTTVCSTAHRPQPLVGASPLPPVVPATRPAASVPHTSASTTQILCSSSNTNALSSNGPVQQRIVINTSTHLAAGTQILLNNARFVVPPQGLAPGSHVLIISGRAPGTGTFTAPAAAPHAGPRNVSAAPRAGALPISPRPTIPCAPPLRSPVAAPTPPVGWPVLTSPVPCATQVCLTGAPMLSSSSMSDATKSVVPTLPRLQGSPRLCSTIAGTPALVTSPVGLDPKPALVFTTKSSVPVPGGTAPTAARSSAGTTKPTPVAASTFPPSTATHLPTTTTLPLSSLLTASSSTVSIHCSGTVPIASVMSVVAQSPEGIPLLSSATPSTKDGQSRMPVVAVSPNVHTVSRTPSLPVATVQPGRGLDSGLRVSPGANAFPPTSSASAVTPANPVGSLKLNEAIHAPVVAMATPALEKPFLQTQTEGHTSVESKLDLTALTATYTNSLQPTTTDLSKP